jgi:hypothetical protein
MTPPHAGAREAPDLARRRPDPADCTVTVALQGRGGDGAVGGACKGHARRGCARRGVAACGGGPGGACAGAARGGGPGGGGETRQYGPAASTCAAPAVPSWSRQIHMCVST